MTTPVRRLRVGAYAICVRDEQILLARYVSPDGAIRHWTLPGGKVEHAEDPYDAVVREVAEETGYEAVVTRLLGVDSRVNVTDRGESGTRHQHNLGIYYRVGIVGGTLRDEIGGSTDRAAWIPSAKVSELERARLVDIGLTLHRTTPETGHIDPIPSSGLLRA